MVTLLYYTKIVPRCYAWLLIFEKKFILYPTDNFHDNNDDDNNDNRIVHILNFIGFYILYGGIGKMFHLSTDIFVFFQREWCCSIHRVGITCSDFKFALIPFHLVCSLYLCKGGFNHFYALIGIKI